MEKQPFFVVALGLSLGILAQDYFAFSSYVPWLMLASALLILLLLIFSPKIWVKKLKTYGWLYASFAIGILIHFLNSSYDEKSLEGNYSLFFNVEKLTKVDEKYRTYIGQSHHSKSNFSKKIILKVPVEEQKLLVNKDYEVDVWFQKLKNPDNDYQFNYKKYLKRRKIFSLGYLKGIRSEKPVDRYQLNSVLNQIHQYLINNVEELPLSDRSKNFLKGITLADKSTMDGNTLEAFRSTGLAHLLAISGTHIAIIFLLMYSLFQFVFRGNNSLIIISSLLAIWIFGLVIGLGNSVFRACLMLTIYYGYQLLQRVPNLLHSISLAALIILLSDCQQFFDVGFQLSFAAVLGIYAYHQHFKKMFPVIKNTWLKKYVEAVSVTLSAQLATFPFLLFYFHQYSLLSFVSNLWVIPLVFLVVASSFVVMILSVFPIDFSPLYEIYDKGIDLFLSTIDSIAAIPNTVMKNIPFSFVELIGCLIVGILFHQFLKNRKVFKYKIRLLFALGVMVIVKLSLDLYYSNIEEIKIHHFYGKEITSVKQSDEVFFYLDESLEEKNSAFIRYIVEPYVTEVRAKKYSVIERKP